ncbi:MAG: glycoside hydrolase family 5 protein [Clostridiales bacterium]|nr:glycoside hydrolase family 5 protein [Clostridiales bacterium]
MKKIFKKASAVFFAALIGLSCMLPAVCADSSLPLLSTKGDKIVDQNGNEVILRGTNFGGWGILEDWFCPYTDPAGVENVYETLVSRFGVEKTHELFKNYRKNWITEQDFKNVSEMGMNVIRLPIWYRCFQSDDNGTWYRDKSGNIDWSELDNMVDLCRKYGLYIIIDLHGLPGYQNDYDHCGRSKSMSLFDDTPEAKRYREVTVDFWTELAKHYKDDTTVAMYDLMNEPLGTNITRDRSLKQVFWDFSDELYREIRKVDGDTIITMEAIWDPSAIPSPNVYGWENIVYQEHLYDVTNPAYLRKMNEIKRAKYNSPFYIGEFYPRGISSFDYLFSIFNKRGVSWTTWTYKGAGNGADNSPWFLYGSSEIEKIDFKNDSYETLSEKWGEVLRTDSGKWKRTAFADYAKLFTNGTVDKAALYSFGITDSVGSKETRKTLFRDKLKAIYTTILDWLRKLKTGDLI